jgi:hypothetical protein
MRRSFLFTLVSITSSSVALVHCGSSSSTGAPADGGPASDGTSPMPETSTPEDGGTPADSGNAADSGAATDTGTGAQDSGATDTGPVGCDADAGMTSCSGTCVDLQTDQSNCGGCGHDCTTGIAGQTALCSAGVCQPIVLENLPTGVTTVGQIATDGSNVVWTSPGTGSQAGVYSVATNKAFQVPTILDQSSGTTYGAAIAMANGQAFYFAQSGTPLATYIGFAAAGNSMSGGNLTTLGATLKGVAVAASGTTVAWGAFASGTNTVYIGQIDASTTSPKPTTDANQVDTNGIAGIATDGTNAYYTQASGLKSVALMSGSTPAAFLTGLQSPSQIVAVTGASPFIYFCDNGADVISRSTIPSPMASKVYDNSSASLPCTGLSADSKYVYFTDTFSDVLYMKVDGTGTLGILAKANQPTAVAVDSKALYYVDTAAGTLNKIALPL